MCLFIYIYVFFARFVSGAIKGTAAFEMAIDHCVPFLGPSFNRALSRSMFHQLRIWGVALDDAGTDVLSRLLLKVLPQEL